MASNYPAPAERWLAWVPFEEWGRGQRRLRCLLCSRYVDYPGYRNDSVEACSRHLKQLRNFRLDNGIYATVQAQREKHDPSGQRADEGTWRFHIDP